MAALAPPPGHQVAEPSPVGCRSAACTVCLDIAVFALYTSGGQRVCSVKRCGCCGHQPLPGFTRLPSGLAGTGIGLLSIAAGPALIASGSVVFVLALILLVPGVTFGCRGFGGCGLFGFGFFIVGFFGCCSGLVL